MPPGANLFNETIAAKRNPPLMGPPFITLFGYGTISGFAKLRPLIESWASNRTAPQGTRRTDMC
jgi:hypothetical protein